MRTIWEVWQMDLPIKFHKETAVRKLGEHWGITMTNVYKKIKSCKFNVVEDLSIFYSVCFIGFDTKKGFFFDKQAFELKMNENETELADSLGLCL